LWADVQITKRWGLVSRVPSLDHGATLPSCAPLLLRLLPRLHRRRLKSRAPQPLQTAVASK
jgi:hypothetical protein